MIAERAPAAFEIPPELEAGAPPEARGLARDQVRLMVSWPSTGRILHDSFRNLPAYLSAGDVLVINTSRTLNAAVMARRADGSCVELHLSTHLPNGRWVIELRAPDPAGTQPLYHARRGETLRLPAGAAVVLRAPYHAWPTGEVRLWEAHLKLPAGLEVAEYLQHNGFPIRYRYVQERWPLEHYQTVFATEPGSAEMPSAGRPFTPELVARLVAHGVQFAPLVLHTGVASLESHEPPYAERYRVPRPTAELVNAARAAGRRVVAVGTTAVRALETAADPDGRVDSSAGWTELVISPERGVRAVTGLLTGLHEPRSSHLMLLAALASHQHLRQAYAEAVRQRYLWHEFGDMHLILTG